MQAGILRRSFHCATFLVCASSSIGQEAEVPEGHKRMLARMAEIGRQVSIDNLFFGTQQLTDAQTKLAGLAPDKLKARWKTLLEISWRQQVMGLDKEAVATLVEAEELAQELGAKLRPNEQSDFLFRLGLAYLRLGAVENRDARHSSASCILPIREGGVHVDQHGSRMAIEYLSQLLERAPTHAAARWLVNVAAMTLGEHPAAVPPASRLDFSRFDSGVAFPRFENQAARFGLDSNSLAGAAVADDFDGDGQLDLVSSSWDPRVGLRFHKGLGAGRYADRSRESGLSAIAGGLQVLHADYDNDGDLDLFVERGAWMRDQGRFPDSLLQNQGDGRFLDVSFDVGIGHVELPTGAAGWADYDLDGDLDLYVANENSPEQRAPSQLWRNEGGRFVDVAMQAGVTNDRFGKGVAWGDWDSDRDPDLYVSNLGGPNRLYRNRGDGTFEDVGTALRVDKPIESFACWPWDYDNDGALDLFVETFVPMLDPYVSWLSGEAKGLEYQALYQGDGSGNFRWNTVAVGLDRPNCAMGSNFGDLDYDGFLDICLATGAPGYESIVPNVVYWNRAGARFDDVTVPGGFGHLQKGHGVAFADFDDDGDEDLFVEIGGAFPGDAFTSGLFVNPGTQNHRIQVKLIGVKSNRCAIGARIRCQITEGGAKRSIFRWVGAGSSFGGNPLNQTIGVGQAAKVDVLEVSWPKSGETQLFYDVPIDRLVSVTEGETKWR